MIVASQRWRKSLWADDKHYGNGFCCCCCPVANFGFATWQNPLSEYKSWQLISQTQVTWLVQSLPQTPWSRTLQWIVVRINSILLQCFLLPLYQIRPMHSQPPQRDMPKIQTVKDYPRSIPILIINIRPAVITRSDSITLNSWNSTKDISFLKKNSQSNTNKAIFLIYFHVIPTQFLRDYHLDIEYFFQS